MSSVSGSCSRVNQVSHFTPWIYDPPPPPHYPHQLLFCPQVWVLRGGGGVLLNEAAEWNKQPTHQQNLCHAEKKYSVFLAYALAGFTFILAAVLANILARFQI